MTRFVFLILPEVHLLDLAGPNQVISEAIDLGVDFEIAYCGIEREIQTSSNLGISNLKHFSEMELKAGDYLVIPGSRVKLLTSFDFKKHSALLEWIVDAHKKGVTLVTVCVGTFVVGEAGLLDHIECTTHFDQTQHLQKRFPKAIVKENILFTSDNNIYTSAGIASGIDLMLHIIEKHTGGNIAHRVARELVVYKRRDGVNEQHSMYFQYRDHIHNGIHKVQDYIIDNISKKLYLHSLAAMANMSERNFSRVFKKETGITVHQFITNIRVEQIRNLFRNPDLSRKQIAKKVGLKSEKQVARLFAANG